MTRSGTALTHDGAVYKFDGLNVYTAVAAPCWWGESLSTALTGIGSGQEVARVFAFQHTATTSGKRNWTYMDAMLAAFRARGQHVILVLTDQWKGQPCTDSSSDRTLGWYQSGYKTKIEGATTYRDWVAQVAERYKDDPTIAFYQLVNEGEARNADGSCSESSAKAALRAFADDVGGLIGSIDPNHLVSLGTIAGECGSEEADYQYIHSSPAIDICDFHDYDFQTSPLGNTDSYNGLVTSLKRCHAAGKAFFVGEIGIEFRSVSPATKDQRSALLDAKLKAQFAAGSSGELIWCWSNTYSSEPPRDMEVTPGDPALSLLKKY